VTGEGSVKAAGGCALQDAGAAANARELRGAFLRRGGFWEHTTNVTLFGLLRLRMMSVCLQSAIGFFADVEAIL
jgi:hypothetical protein